MLKSRPSSRHVTPTRARAFGAIAVAAFVLASLVVAGPAVAQPAGELYPAGSLPEVAKKVNQLIYPTFGRPAIIKRGQTFTIEWDWRMSNPDIPLSALPRSNSTILWRVTASTSVAANVQHYDGTSNDPSAWYNYKNPADPYGYGTYANPVHTSVSSKELRVTRVDRGPSARWPEVFGQAGFTVDRITVQVPANTPLDLYDLRVEFRGAVPAGYLDLVPPERQPGIRSDTQPHALNVVAQYERDIKVVQITDTHVYGQEIESWTGLNYNSFVLREPRPGTPDRAAFLGYHAFPLDTDADGRTNEGAAYLQEELQAINLIDPDFVVFTGDALFAQKNFATYPTGPWAWWAPTGRVGSEYRFEYPWFYDELLALNVPVFCVPGNHDAYCWDDHLSDVPHNDGVEIWQDLFGPLYYSWDYGDYHFLGVDTMDWTKQERNGISVLDYVLWPGKWMGQVRGGGDEWGVGTPPPGSGLVWDPLAPEGYTGQLGWMRDDLAGSASKRLRGVFMHHDPLEEPGSPPGMFDDESLLGLPMPSGKGQGSQSVMNLMRTYDVAFEASGHAHEDWVGSAPWYDGTGEVRAINTTGSEPPVSEGGTSQDYGGYRLVTIEDGQVAGWGFPGGNADPNSKWSIPGWANLEVGTGLPNGSAVYRQNRPSIQWMEQENPPGRPAIAGGEGTFTTPSLPGEVALPLNNPDGTGRFDDVTCTIRNTLDGAHGAALDLSGCRIEFLMKKKAWGWRYAVENGRILEQYDTSGGRARMVVVLADAPAGSVVPVRVHAVR